MMRHLRFLLYAVIGGVIGYVAGVPLKYIIEIIAYGLQGVTESKTIPIVVAVLGAVVGIVAAIVDSASNHSKPRGNAGID